EYQAKVIDDNGLTRGKVPAPLLRLLGARAGDYMIFRQTGSGKVEMRLSRSKKSAKGRTGRR
ncbi:MAG: hypothetical protein WBP93_06705, partial [Pyrinomonadaceae bacterium]